MLCQKCGVNNATTHIRTVIDGVVTEKRLCPICAKSEGYDSFAKGSLMGMLSSMLTQGMVDSGNISNNRCTCCGASFGEIANSGKVGCSHCYEKFKGELLPYLKRVHGSINHIGKKPTTEGLTVIPTDKISEMRKKLSILVKNENYEEAAIVRDEIKKLEEEKNNG